MKQLVTWLLIVAGWVIVHYLTQTRERQKEIRELKSKLIERILEIERRAIDFHQAPHYLPDEARTLLAEVTRVSSAISRQPLSLLGINSKMVTGFRRSITLKNFDPSGFQPQPANSKLVFNISECTEALTDGLEQAYAQRYLDKWWQAFRV